MRKVDIRTRLEQLELRLRSKKDTEAAQADERERLFDACRDAGDHVFTPRLVAINPGDVALVCEFCGARGSIGREEQRRNLVRG
jgi:hypothetical protein